MLMLVGFEMMLMGFSELNVSLLCCGLGILSSCYRTDMCWGGIYRCYEHL